METNLYVSVNGEALDHGGCLPLQNPAAIDYTAEIDPGHLYSVVIYTRDDFGSDIKSVCYNLNADLEPSPTFLGDSMARPVMKPKRMEQYWVSLFLQESQLPMGLRLTDFSTRGHVIRDVRLSISRWAQFNVVSG